LIFEEAGWRIAHSIASKIEDLKIFANEELTYPIFDYEASTLQLPFPEKLIPLELDENDGWRLFKAIIINFSGYLALRTQYKTIFRELETLEPPIAKFLGKLILNLRIFDFLREKHRKHFRDIAFANVISYLLLKPLTTFTKAIERVLTALGSFVLTGCLKGKPEPTEVMILPSLFRLLRKSVSISVENIKDLIYQILKILEESYDIDQQPQYFPVSAYYEVAMPKYYGYSFVSSTITKFMEGYFEEIPLTKRAVFEEVIYLTAEHLSILPMEIRTQERDILEAKSVYASQEAQKEKIKKIIKRDKSRRFRFDKILLPSEDFVEYNKIRRRLSGAILRLILSLKQVKTDDDVEKDEAGLLNVFEAMQVVASQSKRRDVFYREKRRHHIASWTILIDKSKSLSDFKGELKEISICLAEVAHALIEPYNWGFYAFDSSLFVLKDFDESFTTNTKGRIGCLTPGGATFLPDALRFATNKLITRPSSLNVIIPVTDGQPIGYSGIQEETELAVTEAKKKGVRITAIGLGLNSRKHIKKIFSDFVIVRNLSELVNGFLRLYYML
jgi:hypothetical protein